METDKGFEHWLRVEAKEAFDRVVDGREESITMEELSSSIHAILRHAEAAESEAAASAHSPAAKPGRPHPSRG